MIAAANRSGGACRGDDVHVGAQDPSWALEGARGAPRLPRSPTGSTRPEALDWRRRTRRARARRLSRADHGSPTDAGVRRGLLCAELATPAGGRDVRRERGLRGAAGYAAGGARGPTDAQQPARAGGASLTGESGPWRDASSSSPSSRARLTPGDGSLAGGASGAVPGHAAVAREVSATDGSCSASTRATSSSRHGPSWPFGEPRRAPHANITPAGRRCSELAPCSWRSVTPRVPWVTGKSAESLGGRCVASRSLGHSRGCVASPEVDPLRWRFDRRVRSFTKGYAANLWVASRRLGRSRGWGPSAWAGASTLGRREVGRAA